MKINLFIAIVAVFAFQSCSSPSKPQTNEPILVKVAGEAMGTTYHISYLDPQARNCKKPIDSLLDDLNTYVSTYHPSILTDFNKNKISELRLSKTGPQHIKLNLSKSFEVWRRSGGAFDPTIMPLVNYWGFGYDPSKATKKVDNAEVERLKNLIGLGKLIIRLEKNEDIIYSKPDTAMQLDFNAIAQGYSADIIGLLLEKHGINNYLVEVGGEVYAKGHNAAGKPWSIGINTPKEGAETTDFQAIAKLHNRALATSGNYRKAKTVDGVKYSHTINPKTGFPEKSNLLSVSIFAPDAMSADAYATACMVLGLEKGFALIDSTKGYDAYFIYSDPATGAMKTKQTKGLDTVLVVNK